MREISLAALCLLAVGLGLDQQSRPDIGSNGVMTMDELKRESVTVKLGVPYADTVNPAHRLDMYLPKEPKTDRLPVIIYIHGGSWVQGDKAEGAARLVPFVRTGNYAGISPAYRLSGEAQWPAQLYDLKALVRWVRASADEYNFDPSRIGVWGRDAGGHLALMVGFSGDSSDMEGDVTTNSGQSSRVEAVVDFYGVTDLSALVGQPGEIDRSKPSAPEGLLIGGVISENPERAKAASPIGYVRPGNPPVLIVHGTKDMNVPYSQSEKLAAALKAAGVPVYLIAVNGAGHDGVGNLADVRVNDFFNKYLRGETVEVSTEPLGPKETK